MKSRKFWCFAFALLSAACLDFSKDKDDPSDAGSDHQNGGSSGGTSGGASGGTSGGASGHSDAGNTGEAVARCTVDSDCGDAAQFHCISNMCVEYECHAQRPCSGSNACEAHACVPFAPPERFPTGYSQTSGGGASSSSKFRLRASVGTPQPFGKTSSSKYRLVLGPGAGKP